MGRTKADIHMPSSSAYFKGHANDILPYISFTGEDTDRVNLLGASCPRLLTLSYIRKANPAINEGGVAPRCGFVGGFDLNLATYARKKETHLS